MKVTKEQLIEMIKNNEDVSNVDTSEITDMSFLFYENKTFNQDISKWNVSNVVNMQSMFYKSMFNQNISDWDVSNVVNMSYMFAFSYFNQPLKKWKPYNLTNCCGMFLNAFHFNQCLSFLQESHLENIDSLILYTTSYDRIVYLNTDIDISLGNTYESLGTFSNIKNIYSPLFKQKVKSKLFLQNCDFIKEHIFLDE